jgi:hypothetical protein
MNAVVSRRVFVGSVASGLPLLANATHGVIAASPGGQAHDHEVATAAGDPIFDHIVKEMAAILKRGQGRGFTGEDARAVAAQLRTARLRGTELGIDAPMQNGLRDLIHRRGREAALQLQTDNAEIAARLKAYGINVDERRFDVKTLDPETRARAIDGLLSGGITGMFVHAASVFENMAAALDANEGGTFRLRRVQWDPTTRFIYCATLGAQIQMIEAQASVVCALGYLLFDAGLLSACSALTALLISYYALYFSLCP